MTPELAYLVFGGTLCATLLGIALHYYSRGREDRVEGAKHKMLEDEEA